MLGDYIPSKLGFDTDEKVIAMVRIPEWKDNLNIVYVFENGKAVKVSLDNYKTKTNRKRLTNAFSDASPLVNAFLEENEIFIKMVSNSGHAVSLSSELIPLKSTKTSNGVTVFTLKKLQKITEATKVTQDDPEYKKYRKIKIPAKGTVLEESDIEARQLSLE